MADEDKRKSLIQKRIELLNQLSKIEDEIRKLEKPTYRPINHDYDNSPR